MPIAWDTVRYTYGNTITYNTSTYKFTIPITGLWTIEYQITWDGTDTWTNSLLRIHSSGAESVLLQSNQPKNTNRYSHLIVATLPLTAGIDIWASAEQNSVASQPVVTGNRTFISLHYNY